MGDEMIFQALRRMAAVGVLTISLAGTVAQPSYADHSMGGFDFGLGIEGGGAGGGGFGLGIRARFAGRRHGHHRRGRRCGGGFSTCRSGGCAQRMF